MACGTFDWDDVGRGALWRNTQPDEAGTWCFVAKQSILRIIHSKNHLTALIGVENLVVVQAEG